MFRLMRRNVGVGRAIGFGNVLLILFNPELVFFTLTDTLLLLPLFVVRTVDTVFFTMMSSRTFSVLAQCDNAAFDVDNVDADEHEDDVVV